MFEDTPAETGRAMPAKMCPRCQTTKPLDAFYVKRSAKDGRQTYCKDCHPSMVQDRPVQEYMPDAIKRCPRCGELKRGTEYYPNVRGRYGLASYCKECTKEGTRSYGDERAKQEKIIPETKECPRCGEVKPASDYTRSDRTRDGLYSSCKPCWNEYQSRRRQMDRKPKVVKPLTPRQWARQNGYELGDRGRVPAHIMEAYEMHNPTEKP